MAGFLAFNYAAAEPGPNKLPIAGGDGGGNLRCYYDEYVTTGAEQIGDVIGFGPPSGALLKGDRVVSFSMNCDAFGVDTTLAVGDGGDAPRFIAATNVNAASHTNMTLQVGFGHQVANDGPVRVMIAGANCPAGKKIRLCWCVLRS